MTKPFQISSDAGFIWLGEKHREALATLRYGILENKSFLLLTGDVGTGKTTLINALIGSLSDDVVYASVPDPNLDKMDFLNYIASAFEISDDFFETKGKFLSTFGSFLRKTHADNKKVLLIIDESQLLTQELLEEIRLLSNIVTKDSSPILNIFFVGQYEFNEIIRRPENRSVAQRISLNYYIEPLSVEETAEYIRHRLKVAGTTAKIFNASAIKDIFDYSEGFPRRINIICDHCLMSGFAEDKKTITSTIVKESIKDLQLPEHSRQQLQGNSATTVKQAEAQQAETATPVTLGPPAYQAPQNNPLIMEKPTSLLWSMRGMLWIIVLLMSFSVLFLYYTNERYKEATDHFIAIQEKIGLGSADKATEKVQQVSPNNTPTENKTKVLKTPRIPDIPEKASAAKVAASDKKIQESATAPDTKKNEKKKNEKISAIPQVIKTEVVQKVTLPQETETISVSENPKQVEPQKPQLPAETVVIRFKHDSNLFSVLDIEKMKEFAGIMMVHPESKIIISGYTDSTGNKEYNTKLSEFRANMVKSFLMGQNLPPSQMKAQGHGNKNPIGSNDTWKGRVKNRRVEITVASRGEN